MAERIPDRPIAPREGAEPAPSFGREPTPRTYGAPDRARLKRALRAYVMGHDRGWEAERKLREAEREEEREARRRATEAESGRETAGVDRPDRFRGPPAEGELDEATVARTSSGLPESMDEDDPDASVPRSRLGVPVPDRLRFHRGPDVWRDRLRGREAAAPAEAAFRRQAKRPSKKPSTPD